MWWHINGWVQDCNISSALALEILQSWTKPLISYRKRAVTPKHKQWSYHSLLYKIIYIYNNNTAGITRNMYGYSTFRFRPICICILFTNQSAYELHPNCPKNNTSYRIYANSIIYDKLCSKIELTMISAYQVIHWAFHAKDHHRNEGEI